jgi:type VII secretion-associated serine protease mycosin
VSHAGRRRPGQARTSAESVRAPVGARMTASAITLALVVTMAGPVAAGLGGASAAGFVSGSLGGPGTAPAAGLPVSAVSADVIRSRQWWLSTVHVAGAWKWSKGKGVTVAVLDTGVDARHPDLTGQVITGEDFTGGVRRPGNKYWGRHGSAMAGIIAGHGHGDGMSAGVVGVAPQAKVLSIRVTWENDDPLRAGGTEVNRNRDAVAKGIRYAVDHGANIINMSLGGGKLYYDGSPTEEDAIRYALSKGVVLIASAGNDGAGLNRNNFPAAYPGVLAVGAVDRSLLPWRNSNRHDYVKVAAPGVEIVSADAGGGYVLGTGTSPSAAIVAGIAALIRSRYPKLTSVQVAEAMAEGATQAASGGTSPAIGAGVTDALKALYAANRINKTTNADPAVAPPPAPQTEAQTSMGGPNLLLIGVFIAGGVLVVIGLVLGWLQRRRRDDYEEPWPGEEQPPSPARPGAYVQRPENDGWADGNGHPIPVAHRPYEADAPSPWQSGSGATWSHAGEAWQDGLPHDFGEDPQQTGAAPGLPSIEPPAVDESWRSARPVRRRPEVFGQPAIPLEEQPTGAFAAVPPPPEELPTGAFSAVPPLPEELPTGAFFAVPELPDEQPTGAFYAVPEATGEEPTGALSSLPDDHTTGTFAPPPESVNDEPTTAFRMVSPEGSAHDDPAGTLLTEPSGGSFGASSAEHFGGPPGAPVNDPLRDPDPFPGVAAAEPQPLFSPLGDRYPDPLNDPLSDFPGDDFPGDRPPGEQVNASFPDPPGAPLDDRVGDPLSDPPSDPFGGRIGDALSDPLGRPVSDRPGDPLNDPFGGRVGDPLGDPRSDPLDRPVSDPFSDPLGKRVNDVLSDPLGKRANDVLSDPLGKRANDVLSDPLSDPLADPLNPPAGEAFGDPVGDPLGGVMGSARHAPGLDPADDEGHRLPWR